MPENWSYGDGGNFPDIGGKHAEHILQMLHLHPSVALLNGVAYRPGDGVEPLSLTAQLRETGHGDVVAHKGVPGLPTDDAVHGKIDDLLKFPHGGFGLRAENAVHKRAG